MPHVESLCFTRTPRARRRTKVEDLGAQLGFSHQVAVTDLSLGGMGVRSRTPITVGGRYGVRFAAIAGPLFFATVRWCCLRQLEKREDGDCEPVYQGGLAFESELGPDCEQVLGTSIWGELNLSLEAEALTTLDPVPPPTAKAAPGARTLPPAGRVS